MLHLLNQYLNICRIDFESQNYGDPFDIVLKYYILRRLKINSEKG